jgi:putative heme-binding domain-containing protein
VRILASQFFPRNGVPFKLDFINRMEGNVEKGKTTFTTYCITCHKHGEKGNEIGPDLTNVHKKFDKLSLLDAIINPSASMVFGFETYTIQTKQGKFYMGFLIGDNGKNLTLEKRKNGKIFNARPNVNGVKRTRIVRFVQLFDEF